MAPFTLVIIPTHNEAGNIGPLVQQILGSYSHAHILIVDDCSSDGVRNEIRGLEMSHPSSLFSIFRSEKKGIGSAYRVGMIWALDKGYDWVVQMDGDGSHDPDALALLFAALQHTPMVIGSRRVPGGDASGLALGRRPLSRWSSWWARFLLDLPIRDLTGGFNGWHASLLRQLDLQAFVSQRYAFQIELKYRAWSLAKQFVEVPIHFGRRVRGVSKLQLADVFDGLRLVHLLALERRG